MVENKLRVLYLINDLRRGGAERSVTDLCLEFKKRGDIECVIATLFPENQFKETTKDLKVINLDFKGNRFLRKSYTPLYHKLVSDFKPHIIHSNLFLAEFLTLEKVYPEVVYVCHDRDNMPPFINFSWKTITSKR